MFTNSSILTWMLILPILGGMAILGLPATQAKKARSLALFFCLAVFLLSILAVTRFDWWAASYPSFDANRPHGHVQLSLSFNWIRSLGAHYFVGVDGLSLPLVVLSSGIGLMACWASYGVSKSPRGYFALLLFLLTGLIGVLVSLDLLQFFIFLELTMVPLYFLVGVWGGPKREFAATKLFLFTLLGATAILCAVLGVWYHTCGVSGGKGGVLDLIELATNPAIRARFAYGGAAFGFGTIAFWLFFFGFAVRVPAVPVHTWLADTHAQASTPVSMILAGVIQNLGAYGLVRVCYPLFPEQAAYAWYYVALIGVVTIVYGALVAIAQKDLKRLAAFWSISNIGWVILGLSVMSTMAFTGVIFQMVSHGIVATMFFFMLGTLFDRTHHAEIPRLGGLWSQMPAYSGWAALAFLAAMGLPGLSGFIGQLLVLLGTFSAGDSGGFLMTRNGGDASSSLLWMGGIAAAAMLLTAGYLLWTFQRVFMGASRPEHHNFAGLSTAEKWILAALGLGSVALGVAPMLLLDRTRSAIEGLMKLMSSS